MPTSNNIQISTGSTPNLELGADNNPQNLELGSQAPHVAPNGREIFAFTSKRTCEILYSSDGRGGITYSSLDWKALNNLEASEALELAAHLKKKLPVDSTDPRKQSTLQPPVDPNSIGDRTAGKLAAACELLDIKFTPAVRNQAQFLQHKHNAFFELKRKLRPVSQAMKGETPTSVSHWAKPDKFKKSANHLARIGTKKGLNFLFSMLALLCRMEIPGLELDDVLEMDDNDLTDLKTTAQLFSGLTSEGGLKESLAKIGVKPENSALAAKHTAEAWNSYNPKPTVESALNAYTREVINHYGLGEASSLAQLDLKKIATEQAGLTFKLFHGENADELANAISFRKETKDPILGDLKLGTQHYTDLHLLQREYDKAKATNDPQQIATAATKLQNKYLEISTEIFEKSLTEAQAEHTMRYVKDPENKFAQWQQDQVFAPRNETGESKPESTGVPTPPVPRPTPDTSAPVNPLDPRHSGGPTPVPTPAPEPAGPTSPHFGGR